MPPSWVQTRKYLLIQNVICFLDLSRNKVFTFVMNTILRFIAHILPQRLLPVLVVNRCYMVINDLSRTLSHEVATVSGDVTLMATMTSLMT